MTHAFTRRDALRFGAGLGAIAALGACAVPADTTPDIVDAAVDAGSFSTLVAAVQAAGLVETLKSPGPFTVFAPTDAAFAALPAGTLDSLLLPQNQDQLVEILTYHVVPGRAPAAQLTGTFGTLTTVEGRAVRVDGRNGVRINDTSVITADVITSNGIIHAIDGVLLPR